MRDDESAVDQAKQALQEAKARRVELDETDPKRLADQLILEKESGLAQAERDALLRQYQERQARANALVADYQQASVQFDERLAALLGVVTELSRLTAAIEAERAQLWEWSRLLQRSDIGCQFTAKEWFSQATTALRRAWRAGQST